MGDTAVDLDSLTAKQLAKEFKLTGKEVKSKDLSVRQVALKKFEQTRYLLEGGLIVPFIETIVSKKKTIEYTKLALESLLKFLSDRSSEVAPGVLAVDTILNLSGSLNGLENVTSLVFYKEEVKKVKGKPVIVKESEMEASLRSLSLSCLTIIACDIQSDVTRCQKFALIPNIQNYLCAYLDNIPKRNEDPDLQVATLKEGVLVLRLLVLVLRYCPNAITALTENATTNAVLFDVLIDVPEYTLYCMEVYSILAEDPSGMKFFTADPKFLQKVLSVAHDASGKIAGPLGANTDYAARFSSFAEKNAAAAAAGGGGKEKKDTKKDTKKDAGKGKTEAAPGGVEEAVDGSDLTDFTIEPARLQACVLKAVCNLLICVATKAPEFITAADTPDMVKLLSNVMLSHEVWVATAHVSAKEPNELKTGDLVGSLCMFFSMISRVTDATVRTEACGAGALNCLMLVIFESQEVCQLHEEVSEEDTVRLNSLRRLAEQAILMLSTTPVEPTPETEKNGTAGGNVYRWASCNGFATDMSLFAVSPEEKSDFPVLLLMELVSNEKDVDMANRGVRMLAAVMQGSPDPFAFCTNIFPTDLQATPRLSTLIQARATTLLGVEGLKLDSEEHLDKKGDNTALLTPDVFESIYHALCVTHVLIQNAAELVNVFATDERVKLLVQTAYMCGPVGARNTKNGASLERKVSLYDTRHVTWHSVGVMDEVLATPANTNDTNISAANHVILRSVLFDIFSDIGNSDAKYRTYTDDVLPAAILMPISESTCPCADAAARICKYCTDIAIATIQVTGRFELANGRVIMSPQEDFAFALDHEVLQASLRTLSAIATTGIHGIVTALENIANKGLNTAAPVTPTDSLDGFSSVASLEAYLKAGVAPECVPIANPWKRPEHYDTYFTSGSLVNADGLVNDEANVGTASEFWPFVVLCGAMLSVLHNPYTPSNIVKTAITSVKSFAALPQFQHYIQPVVVDLFNTVLLSMGGGVVIPCCLGRFGIAGEEGSPEGVELAGYLFNRGSCREIQWDIYATQKAEEEAAAAAAAEADPKAAKAKPPEKKKEDKKGAAVVATIPLHYAPEESPSTEIDPNHGPNCNHWLKLLNLQFNDIHALAANSHPLTACIYSGHRDLASTLISLEVDVNVMVDDCSPLMFALVLQEGEIVTQLLTGSIADVNAIGAASSSCVKYACLSLAPETISSVLKEAFRKVDGRSTDIIEVLGSTHLIHHMTAAGVDVNVSDADTGNYPLHCCSGLGQANVKIGGYNLHITNDAYDQAIAESDSRCQKAIRLLRERGADVNKCNADGQTVLHVVSAHSDCATMDFLIHSDARVNVLDKYGLYPLHYVAIGGESADAIKAFDLLFGYAVGRDMQAAAYADVRTGQPLDAKFGMDIDSLFDDVFGAIVVPPAIVNNRMEAADVLCSLSKENLSILQIAMASNSFHDQPFELFARFGTKTFRMELALHIYKTACTHQVADLLLSNVDDFGLTTLHAASLLFAGITPQRVLKPIEKTKRNRKFASTELHLLEVLEGLSNSGAIDINASCSRTLKDIEITHSWTALHGCIVGDNHEMLARLLAMGGNSFQYPYVYFAAQFTNMSSPTAKLIVDACANNTSTIANQLLNERHEGISRPIFSAIRHHNNALLRELVCCEKCQMNNSDMLSEGRNSIHEVVHNAFLPDGPDGNSFELGMHLLETFEIYGGDRIDLLVPDHSGNTVIDEVIEHRNIDMLRIFVSMRKTDVVEKLITQENVHRAVVGRLTSGYDSFCLMNRNASEEPADTVEGAEPAAEKATDADKEVVSISVALEGFQLAMEDTNPDVADDAFGESILMILEREFIELAEKAGFHDYDSDPVAEEVVEAGESADDAVGSGVVTPGFVAGSSQIIGLDPNAPPDGERADEAPPPPKVERVKGVMTPELAQFQEFIAVIMNALESVGCSLVAEDAHAHACFHNGILYTDYCNAQCE